MSHALVKLAHAAPFGGHKKWVLVKLAFYVFGDEPTCYPAVETIARELFISIRTAQSYLRELEKEDYIAIENRGHKNPNGQRTNLYRINVDKLKWCISCTTCGANTASHMVQNTTKSGAEFAPNHKESSMGSSSDSDIPLPPFVIVTEAEALRIIEEAQKKNLPQISPGDTV